MLIPVTVVFSPACSGHRVSVFSRLAPQYLGRTTTFWAFVVAAYLSNAIICASLLHNYRAIRPSSAVYLSSTEHQSELYAWTVLVTDVPNSLRSDHAVGELFGTPGTGSIGREVEDLPKLANAYGRRVERLQISHHFHPDQDRSADVNDVQAKAAQDRWPAAGKMRPLSYCFVTFRTASAAHCAADEHRKRGANVTTVRPTAGPKDLSWRNLDLSEKTHARRKVFSQIAVAILTVVWLLLNVLIAVLLSNLSHLAAVCPAFRNNLHAHTIAWAAF